MKSCFYKVIIEVCQHKGFEVYAKPIMCDEIPDDEDHHTIEYIPYTTDKNVMEKRIVDFVNKEIKERTLQLEHQVVYKYQSFWDDDYFYLSLT